MQLTNHTRQQWWNSPMLGVILVVTLLTVGMIATQSVKSNQAAGEVSTETLTTTEERTESRKLADLSTLGLLQLGQPMTGIQQIVASPFLKNIGGALQISPDVKTEAVLPGITDLDNEPILGKLMTGELDLTAQQFQVCELRLYFWDWDNPEADDTLAVIHLIPKSGKLNINEARAWLLSRYDVDQMETVQDTPDSLVIQDNKGRSVYINTRSIRFIDGAAFDPSQTQDKSTYTTQSSTRAAPPGVRLFRL